MPDIDYRSYWETNIGEWGEVYLDLSHGHERLDAPRWFSRVYRASIGRIEKKLMRERYRRTVAFLDQQVRPGTTVSDLGCGTGIFVVEALRRGATVNAVDFSGRALDITRRNVERYCGDRRVIYHQADVQRDELPRSDVTLAMGLTPYLTDLPAFIGHALPKTRMIYCLYVDPRHIANRLRAAVPALNVRGLRYHGRADVDRLYALYDWKLVERRNFATGYIDLACSGASPIADMGET